MRSVPAHVCCLFFLIFRLESAHCHGNHRHHSGIPLSKNIKISHTDHSNPQYNQSGEIPDHRFFLTELFSKYGYNGVMTFEGFEHLLENLNLGGIIIKDHDLSSHREQDNGFKNNHPHHEHKPSPKQFDGITVSTEPTNQEDRITHNSHDDFSHHHDDHELIEEINKSKSNTSGAGIWHYMPEFINITSLFQQHHEFAEQDNNVVVVREQGCLSASEMLKTFNIRNKISPMGFLHLCPAIIYELDQRHCIDIASYYRTDGHIETSATDVWLYSSLAVIVISLCGLLSVAVIPIMQKVFYQTLLQFLVGLAIGSLSGDAFLHLLPHAMTTNNGHDHSEEAIKEEEAMVFRGLMALGGVYMFFLAERLLNSFSSFRQKKKAKRIRLQLESNEKSRDINIGEKLSDYRRSSYKSNAEDKEVLQMLNETSSDERHYEKLPKSTYTIPIHQLPQSFQIGDKEDRKETMVFGHSDSDHSFVIPISDHQHSHSHGHSHELPSSMTTVALMVIMGDGLHNFCDGLAIGAAFSTGIPGGFSTTVAVFCHELPHELGDFAMLLKTGMSAKQALFYNGVSSVLCFLGMAIGIALGNLTSATKWIFAATAGMFVYIALVDMMPELETSKNSVRRLALQFLGISIGISIMLLIAIYEHDLKHIMN